MAAKVEGTKAVAAMAAVTRAAESAAREETAVGRVVEVDGAAPAAPMAAVGWEAVAAEPAGKAAAKNEHAPGPTKPAATGQKKKRHEREDQEVSHTKENQPN